MTSQPPSRPRSGPRPRRSVLALLSALVAGVAGCLGAPSPSPSTASRTPTGTPAGTPTDIPTATPRPDDTVAFESLSPRTRRVVEEAIRTDRAVADRSVVKTFRDGGYEYVRYEGARYRIGFDWIVTYDIRPAETNCSEATPEQTVSYENLSTDAREAFETGLDAGEYEARDYAFPDQLRHHDYVRRNRTCYWLYRLHGDTSMYEVRAERAGS